MEPAIEQEGAVERGPAGERRGRTRTCVGCGERVVLTPGDAPSPGALPLVRLILGPEGVLAVDPGGGGFGRGAHVHPRPECLARAVQRGLPRVSKGRTRAVHVDGSDVPVQLTVASLAQAIRQAMDRRVQGLLRAAVRSRSVAVGADAVTAACERGADLVVVACDAAAAAELPQVQRAIADGRAVAWGTKQALGAIVGEQREQGVAVVAILSGRLAAAIAEDVRVADACGSSERAAPAKAARRARPEAAPAKAARRARPEAAPEGARAPEGAYAPEGAQHGRVQRGARSARGATPGLPSGGTGASAAKERRPRGWVRRIG